MERGAGVLLHITSLNNAFGSGCFSKDAFAFIDFLKETKLKYWQILPLQPVDNVGCPYRNLSLFAIEPMLIDLEEFLSKDELKRKGLSKKLSFNEERALKMKILFDVFVNIKKSEEQKIFENENNFWLEDYATFMSLIYSQNKEMEHFVKDYLILSKEKIKSLSKGLEKEKEFAKWIQFVAFSQWQRIRQYANSSGIKIIGDMPFYPAPNSDIVLLHPELFQTKNNHISFIAGVPPDYFNKDGQVWFNPVYDVKFIKNTNYDFVLRRFNHLEKMYDYIRIDHFRAYQEFFKIPLDNPLAKNGKWEKGFGKKPFELMQKELLEKIILEDLGIIDKKVVSLKNKLGFPNMKVYQFAFDGDDKNVHLSKNYEKNCIAYLGTHDNSTFCGFLEESSTNTRELVLKDLHLINNATNEQICYSAIENLMSSNADVIILLPQDLLCQNNKYRINTPGTIGINWKYELPKKFFNNNIKNYLISSTLLHNR